MTDIRHRTPLSVDEYLAAATDAPPREVVKPGQDSRAWLADLDGRRCFLKWVPADRYETRLAKDVAICTARLHPAIVPLLDVVRTADGVLLVFEQVEGENVGQFRPRFFALPLEQKVRALASIFGALAAIADAGWIAVDFYEGNVIYDYRAAAVWLFDFELFERGPAFTLQLDRNYGSSRLMAPEEFVRGARIDEATNAFTLGRYAINALCRRIDAGWREAFQGPPEMAAVLARATAGDRTQRYQRVRDFEQAFAASGRPSPLRSGVPWPAARGARAAPLRDDAR